MPKGIPKNGINKGWKKTDAIKKKISDSIKGENHPFFGKHQKKESIEKMKATFKRTGVLAGKNNPAWTGGSMKYAMSQAIKRDDYTCQKCGLKDEEIIVADHIKPKIIYPELKDILENIQALCPNCHARKTVNELEEIIRIKKLKI